MLGYLLFAAAAYFAYKTNPNEDTLKLKLQQDHENDKQKQKKGKNFFSKLIAPLNPITRYSLPNYTLENYLFFTLARLSNRSKALYIGCFGSWFELSAALPSESTNNNGGGGSASLSRSDSRQSSSSDAVLYNEQRALGEIEKATAAKTRRDYKSAAAAFYNAAKLFQASDDSANAHVEAARSYEDASKCYNMIKEAGKSADCLESAAQLFRGVPGSGSRAARIYDSLGDIYRKPPVSASPLNSVLSAASINKSKSVFDLTKAKRMYQEAAELFEAEGDERCVFSKTHVAVLCAETEDYASAIENFTSLISRLGDDPTLQYNVRKHVFHLLICHIALGDWIAVETQLSRYADAYPGLFARSRECALIHGLANAVRALDTVTYADRCKEYDAVTTLDGWVVTVLLRERKKLEARAAGEVEDLR